MMAELILGPKTVIMEEKMSTTEQEYKQESILERKKERKMLYVVVKIVLFDLVLDIHFFPFFSRHKV